MTSASDLMFLWLINFCLHSSVLLGLVSWLDHKQWVRSSVLLEWLWRVAVLTSLISASVSLSGISPSAALMQIEPLKTSSMAPPEDSRLSGSPAEGSKRLTETRLTEANSDVPVYPISNGADSAITENANSKPNPDSATDVHQNQNTADLKTLVLYAWLLMICILNCRLVYQYRRTHLGIADRRHLPDQHPVNHMLQRLCDTAVDSASLKKMPTVSASDSLVSPVTLAGNEICLPCWTVSEMDAEQHRAILAHELAHCIRRDPLWFVVMDVVKRIFFFNPLIHRAHQRLVELAEIRADETAIYLTGNRRALARSLTECASHYQPLKPLPGVAMANQPSSFINRIERLLSPRAFQHGRVSRQTLSIVLLGMLSLALMLPGFIYEAKAARSGTSTHITTHDDGRLDELSMSISQDGYRLKIEADGHFELNEDESDLATLEAGSAFEISEVSEGNEHRIEFSATRDGIDRRFWIDGEEQPFDDQTRAWLSELLPRVMRETALNADQRATRIHRQSGISGLLDEIELIRGDFAARRYIVWLVRNDDLNANEYMRLLRSVSGIGSDYEMRQTLIQIATHEKLNDERAVELLDLGASIDSDYELRTLTDHLVKESDIEQLAADRLIEVISSIDSDYEMRTAFMTMLEDAELTAAELEDTLDIASRSIDSDYELRVLLDQLSRGAATDESLALGYLKAVHQIDSDYERRVALDNLVKQAGGLEDIWVTVIETAAGIDGDYELAESLVAIARQMPSSDVNHEAYRNAAMRIGGQYERTRALDAIGG